jgi:hypothetical protein
MAASLDGSACDEKRGDYTICVWSNARAVVRFRTVWEALGRPALQLASMSESKLQDRIVALQP